MPVKVKVTCSPDPIPADELRKLFCVEARSEPVKGRNPLLGTTFNELLDRITQIAFDEGRQYERDLGKKTP